MGRMKFQTANLKYQIEYDRTSTIIASYRMHCRSVEPHVAEIIFDAGIIY